MSSQTRSARGQAVHRPELSHVVDARADPHQVCVYEPNTEDEKQAWILADEGSVISRGDWQ